MRKNVIVFFLVCLVVISLGCKEREVSTIGSIDNEVIMDLPEFLAVQKDIDKEKANMQKEFAQLVEGLNESQKAALANQYDEKLYLLQKSKLAPLLEKEENIIKQVAEEEGLSVVVDNSIVLWGVKDITDKVVAKFTAKENKENASHKKVKKIKKQLIGYIDGERLKELPEIKRAQDKYDLIVMDMEKSISEEIRGKTEEEQQKIFESYNQKREKKWDEIFAPLQKRIDEITKEVSKEKGLILVLDKESIFYGGEDVTGDVMERFKPQE